MARHVSQAVLSRVIGSFSDSVKYYFCAKNRITLSLQSVIYEVLFYHIFFRCFFGFYHSLPITFAASIYTVHLTYKFAARIYCEALIPIIANLAALAKACKKVL